LDIFIDPAVPRPSLLIVGVSSSAQALASRAGFDVSAAASAVAGARKAAAGSAIDPVGGMSVEVATAEFTSEYLRRTHYFCCAGCQHSFEKLPQHYLQSGEGSA
jgi:YHS domain-containing protein